MSHRHLQQLYYLHNYTIEITITEQVHSWNPYLNTNIMNKLARFYLTVCIS